LIAVPASLREVFTELPNSAGLPLPLPGLNHIVKLAASAKVSPVSSYFLRNGQLMQIIYITWEKVI
jgi:hypothetical protein